MRVLFIEDDDQIAQDVGDALRSAGFEAERCADGASGRVAGAGGDFAAIVLDLGLPDVDGLTVLKAWREEGLATPVLILTARGSWMERVTGLDSGADDYLAKPFQMEELIARVRALVRRSPDSARPIRNRSDLAIDPERKLVSFQGQSISLTPYEYKAVTYLARNCGRVVSSAELIAHVHGSADAVSGNAMEALIGRIRRKVGNEVIETRRGFGYIIPEA